MHHEILKVKRLVAAYSGLQTISVINKGKDHEIWGKGRGRLRRREHHSVQAQLLSRKVRVVMVGKRTCVSNSVQSNVKLNIVSYNILIGVLAHFRNISAYQNKNANLWQEMHFLGLLFSIYAHSARSLEPKA